MDYEALEKEADELLNQHNAAYQKERDDLHDLILNDNSPTEDEIDDTDEEPPRKDDDSAEKIRVYEERVRNAQAKMHQSAQEAAELRRKVAELDSALKAVQAKGEDDSALEDAGKSYPEIVSPLLAKIAKLEARIEELQGNVQKTERRVLETEEAAAGSAHLSAILKEHPDALDVIEQASFKSWKEKQPEAIQSITETGSAKDVNWMLSQYKSSLGKKKQDNDPSNLSMPNMPRARKPSTDAQRFTREQIRAMTPEEFTKNESLIDEAMASGLIF